MSESTRIPAHPTDESGRELTDSEIAAVVRHRPHALTLMLMHRGDHIHVQDAGVQVQWGTGDAGTVMIASSVIRAALDAAQDDPQE